MKNFINELKRRNVIKASLAYLVIAWVLLQVFQFLLPMLGAPEWLLPTITLVLAIGLPVWIIVSWIYEITPEGIEKTAKVSENELVSEITNKRLNVFIIVSLSIAVIVMGLKMTNVFDNNSDRQYAIAVMPFDNIKVDEGNEWLSESFSLDVNSYISKVSQLQVTDFYTTKRYIDSDKTNTEIGKELDVTYLLRGTVRESDNKLSITIDLIDAKANKKIWTGNYDGIIQDKKTLQIQQQVAQIIVEKLNIKLTHQEDAIIKKLPTENPEAQYLFTKGRELTIQRRKEDLEESIEYYQKAIDLDSEYAEAYAEIGNSYYLLSLPWISEYDNEKYAKLAVSYLDKAMKLNPNLFRVYAVKAMKIQGQDWDKGGEYFEKAIALNPNDASVHMQYGLHLIWKPIPNLEKSLEQFKIAQKLEPYTSQKNQHLINSFLRSGKVMEAEEHFNKMRFLMTKKRQLEFEGRIKANKSKDWTAAVRFYEAEIKRDSNNITLNKLLAEAYDVVFNDDSNAIKYAKKAYELDSTNAPNTRLYVSLLIEGKQFAEANKILQSENYKLINNRKRQLENLWYYYYHQKKYKKAQEVLNDSLTFGETKFYYTAILLTHSQLGDRKYIERELKEYYNEYQNWQKAFVYAILKEKDSMYHYLEKLDPLNAEMKAPNSRGEFDSYRKEERYKALLRKHYLPITHWNE